MSSKNTYTATDALLEVSRALRADVDLLTLLRHLKDVAVRLLDGERASVYVHDRDKRETWTLVADGDAVIRMPEGVGIVGDVIATNKFLNVADVTTDSRFYDAADRLSGFHTRAVLCAPMRNRLGEAIGALEVLNKRSGDFTPVDEDLLWALSTQAGMALENVEMYREMQRNLAQFRLRCGVQEKVNFSTDLDGIFGVVLSELVAAVDGSRGVIAVPSDSDKVVYYGLSGPGGLVQWESDEERECPRFLRDLSARVAEVRQSRPESDVFREGGILYAAFPADHNRGRGYIAVDCGVGERLPAVEEPLDYLKVMAGQTVAILERRRAMEERKLSEKQALLGTMLSMVVHDIKNPLSGVSGFTQMIRHKAADPTIKGYCDTVLEVLERIEHMNAELLAFVRGEPLRLDKKRVVFPGTIGKLLDTCREAYTHAKIEIRVACLEDVAVWADEERLSRAFMNVLGNARDAMPEGGAIAVTIARRESGVEVAIGDTGCGIPAHILERIFEPFVTYGKRKGPGLGLVIVRSIVEQHGGTIAVRSTLGKGTVFTIYIPDGSKEQLNECSHA